jgi:hypothetical protein
MSSGTQLVLDKDKKERLDMLLTQLLQNQLVMSELIKKYAKESKSNNDSD